jgi:hypothetical protein
MNEIKKGVAVAREKAGKVKYKMQYITFVSNHYRISCTHWRCIRKCQTNRKSDGELTGTPVIKTVFTKLS